MSILGKGHRLHRWQQVECADRYLLAHAGPLYILNIWISVHQQPNTHYNSTYLGVVQYSRLIQSEIWSYWMFHNALILLFKVNHVSGQQRKYWWRILSVSCNLGAPFLALMMDESSVNHGSLRNICTTLSSIVYISTQYAAIANIFYTDEILESSH